jgi:hypothetical protein
MPLEVCLRTEGRQCGFFSAECLLSSSRLLVLMLRRSSHTSSRLGNNKKNREDETEDTVCLFPSYEGHLAHYALGTAQSLKTWLITNMFSYWRTRSSRLLRRLPDILKKLTALIFLAMGPWIRRWYFPSKPRGDITQPSNTTTQQTECLGNHTVVTSKSLYSYC